MNPRRVARSAFLLFLLIVLSVATSTQPEPPQSADEEGPIQLVLWGPYWSVAPGFVSTLEMKNNRAQETLTAHVSLYFASGEEYYVGPMILAPRQAAVLNLNEVIEALPRGVRTRASREGTLEVTAEAPNDAAIMGAVSVRKAEQGIAWNFRLYVADPAMPIAPIRGLFWFRGNETEGFVVLQNASEESLTVTPRFHINSSFHALPSLTLLPGQGHKLNIRAALRNLGLQGVRRGGMEFVYEGSADALKAHGVLYDEQGFSMEMDFHPFVQWSEQHTVAFRTPRLAVGRADIRLGLPEGTRFEPMLILHNFNAHSLNTSLRLGYEVGGAHQESQVALSFAPGESRVVSLLPYLAGAVAAHQPWANLELTYQDWHRGLLAELVSVSENGDHSIRSVMNWVEGSGGEGWHWRADATFNTLIGILNASEDTAKVNVSLDYTVSGLSFSYDLPQITIAPRASQLVDVGAILGAGQPDANGDVIPPGVGYGGYKVRKVAGKPGDPIVTEALVIDRQGNNFLTMYNTCCLYIGVVFFVNPGSGFPGDTTQLNVTGKNKCTGAIEVITDMATFDSLNPGIVEIGPAEGVATMVSPGSATLHAFVVYPGGIVIPGEGCPIAEVDRFNTVTVNDFNVSGAQSIKDGQQGSFSVAVTHGTATVYQWSFTAPSGAGNNPNVNFTAPTSSQTNTDGHWFAKPNVACPTSADIPSYYDAIYTIKATVTFTGGKSKTKSTTLTVNSLWNPAGFVDPNIAEVTGGPEVGVDGSGTWRVIGMGTLARFVPTQATIFVIPMSQFYNKVFQHEQVHLNQWIAGPGHLFGDLYIPDDFFNQIRNITGTSQQDLFNKLVQAKTVYINGQGALYQRRINQSEIAAHAVSDPIAPQYVYQNCGQYGN